MQTIKTDIYTLDELDDKAKEKARDWYRERDDMPFLEEYIEEMLHAALATHEITYNEKEASGKAYETFNQLYVDICEQLAKDGYAYIEDERRDDRVDENILANEYTFTKDGKRFG